MIKVLTKLIRSVPLQRIINKRALSACFGYVANYRFTPVVLQYLIGKFVDAFQIDLSEFDLKMSDVQSFNDFFARKLKPGVRKMMSDCVSPVDGCIQSVGLFDEHQLMLVKSQKYHLSELIQSKPEFNIGSFLTIYLSLEDYHRVHFPFDCTITEVKYIPGTLYSLHPDTLTKVKGVYCRNERIVLRGYSNFGKFYLILVGAIVVGKIKLSFMNTFIHTATFPKNQSFKKGDEAGSFEMGSSVILLMENAMLDNQVLLSENKIRMGDSIC